MAYKLLVLDIDGTVTNSDKKVLKETREAVVHLQEKGIHVAIASGRAPQGIYSVAEELELDRFGNYILAFNGAKIINFQTKECIYEKKLPLNIPLQLLKDAVKCGLGFLTYGPDFLMAGTAPDPYMMLEAKISNMPLKYCGNLRAEINFPVHGCLLTGDPVNIEVMEPEFVRKYCHETEIFRSEPCFLEVVSKNVDKAYSLKHLLRILGIPREEMVCCGDSFNDISMIQFAGLGVAMANGQEKLKMIANYVTDADNDHNGIAEVIGKFF